MLTVSAKRLLAMLGLIAALLVPSLAGAATSEPVSPMAVSARLITAENGVAHGAGSLSAGLALDLEEGWKTYWRSPGEVGFPPEIDWEGSENVADVEMQWPAPERFTAFGIENFGYRDAVVFPLRISLAEPGAPVRLSAAVTLLACSDVCVPQEFTLTLDLPRGTGIDAESAELITTYANRVPVDATAARIEMAEAAIDEQASDLILSVRRETPFSDPDVFPEFGAEMSFGRPDIRLGDGGRLLWASLPILSGAETRPESASLTITGAAGPDVTVSPDIVEVIPPPPFTVMRAAPEVSALVWIAATAFLGGLILNLMPCVLPVLSIKLGAAMRAGGDERSHVRRGFLASAAGVMAFMWALAVILFSLQQAGVTVGWGLQFQNPVFLAFMVLILAIFAANLAGGFEIALPSRLQTRLSNAGAGRGHAGDFLAGAFAAVLATPCSAPFLGTAVAFALAGRGVDIAIVFTFLGLGLATPYLVVAARPALVRRLPRPGRWMTALRLVLGLLLALTAIWLVCVMHGVAGMRTTLAVLAVTGLVVALLCLPRPGPRLRALAVVPLAVLAVALPAWLSDAAGDASPSAGGAEWSTFDRAEIPRLVSTGRVVFVDVTADWCLTCKANKALVLDREPVASALSEPGVTAMQADWTRSDPAISRYLESFGRYGIPFNAVFGPAAPEGIVLPELLTTEAVTQALARAKLPQLASPDG